jgi:hypothetical protein
LLKAEKVAFNVDKDSEIGRRIKEDLTAPKYRIVGDKQVEVEPKISGSGKSESGDKWGIKDRLGRSTDEGDAVVQGYFESRLQNDTDYSRVF